MPNRPAPRNPAARPPSRPGRLKKPRPPVFSGAPMPGLVGCVIVRSKGRATLGAVDVDGGAENVRAPREPELKPPPIRASAAETDSATGMATDRTTANVLTKAHIRCVNLIAHSSIPGRGTAQLTWRLPYEKEAPTAAHSCGARSRLRPSICVGPRIKSVLSVKLA